MIRVLALLITPFLDLPFVRRVRRNHGLEHATIHVLSRRLKDLTVAGRSTVTGFYLYGNIPTPEVEAAVQEALRRLRGGEHSLAVHPNCGTGLVTAGLLSGMAALMGTTGMRNTLKDRLSRLPSVILLSTFALVLAQPLGLLLQQYFTTSADLEDTEVVAIQRSEVALPVPGKRVTVHFVRTRSS